MLYKTMQRNAMSIQCSSGKDNEGNYIYTVFSSIKTYLTSNILFWQLLSYKVQSGYMYNTLFSLYTNTSRARVTIYKLEAWCGFGDLLLHNMDILYPTCILFLLFDTWNEFNMYIKLSDLNSIDKFWMVCFR